MMIYFKYGFTNFIKSTYEKEPATNVDEKPREFLVNYYSKDLTENIDKKSVNGKIIAICDKIASGKTYYI